MAILESIGNWFNQYSIIFEILIFVVGWIVERKFKIINRIKKAWAKIRNSPAMARMTLEYTTGLEFEKICDVIKKSFREGSDFRVVNKTEISIDFSYDIFSVKIILNSVGNLFIEINRFSSGINDLKQKIEDLMVNFDNLKSTDMDDSRVLKDFVASEVNLYLPYKWENFDLISSKKFKLKGYSINLMDDKYKSEIDITLAGIKLKTKIRDSIVPIVEKFL